MGDTETSEEGVVYNKWQQLFLLISEQLEQVEGEEEDDYDVGYVECLHWILECIERLNEGKLAYHVN